MALTIAQQIDLINNDTIADGYKLSDFVLQVTINEIESFTLSKKSFDAETYPLAAIYVNKLSEVMDGIKRKPLWVVKIIIKIMVSAMSDSVTPAQVSGATTDVWGTVLSNNILKCLETLAGIYPEEKTEYDSI